MKVGFYFIILFGFSVFYSCKQEKATDSIPVLNLVGVLEGNKTIALSDISSEIKTVQLETSDDILINRIQDVILSDKNIIVIHDNQCSVFDLEGNFIRKISSRGQGPREYISINNLSVTGDTLWIFDSNKMLAFYISGEFLFSSATSNRLHYKMVFDGINIGYRSNRSGSENTKLLFFDKQGVPFDSISYLKQYENLSEIVVVVFPEVIMYSCNGSVRLKELTNDTLFSISTERLLTPLYIMDLGKYAPKEEERYQLYNPQQNVFEGKKRFNSIIETNTYLIISVMGMEQNRQILYNKETGLLENIAFRYNDEIRNRLGKEFFNPKFITENKQYLISYEAHEDIDNDDNPVLVLVRLK